MAPVLKGYVAARFLGMPAPDAFPSATLEVHLPAHANARRDHAGAWAYPLSEAGQPRRQGQDPAGRVQALNQIIDWIDVEHSARHRKQGGLTYCNVYAYDYCYLSGAYLARVWWKPDVLNRVLQGDAQPVLYAQTVEELRANVLFDWLLSFGARFGWQRRFDLNEAQTLANQGSVVLIIAKRKDTDRPGHVAAVVPETPAAQAQRDASGQVRLPLQSQAGAQNFKRRAAPNWWTGNQFREWAIWAHD